MIGDTPAGMITLETRSARWPACPPAAPSAAPITPPMSACDELDGIPKYQVSRFQVIPPARPAATTWSVTTPVSTRPLAIVAATASERNAPTRLSTPERATATRGGSAPVAIEVAIALPVSWKPLVKSKARAVMTTSTRTRSLCTQAGSLLRGGDVETTTGKDKECSLARNLAPSCWSNAPIGGPRPLGVRLRPYGRKGLGV